MATNKRVFTLRLSDEVFDKIGVLATKEHRSITNYIEYVLLKQRPEEHKQKDVEEHHAEGYSEHAAGLQKCFLSDLLP